MYVYVCGSVHIFVLSAGGVEYTECISAEG